MTVLQQQIGHNLGFAAVSNGDGANNKTNTNGSTGAQDVGLDVDNADTIATLDARLATIDSGFYTDARLATMTYNDKIYAVRVNDYAGTIKQ